MTTDYCLLSLVLLSRGRVVPVLALSRCHVILLSRSCCLVVLLSVLISRALAKAQIAIQQRECDGGEQY